VAPNDLKTRVPAAVVLPAAAGPAIGSYAV
jgi:hypothetical protein